MLVRDKPKPKLSNNNPPGLSENGVDSFVKLEPCVDRIRPLLGLSLENRIHSVLQEFVCKSGSRYARGFPRVKRFLDVVAAWADYIDISSKDTDVRQEMIKHAIEYLVKDGLVTQFADTLVLNSQPNKVDPDSSAIGRNALKSMNVWRFINEKDYWLCQDCAVSTSIEEENDSNVHRCEKGCCNSDLDVEVGSISKELPVRDPLCNEKIDDKKFHTNDNCRDVEFTFRPKQNVSLNLRREKIEDAKPFRTQINRRDLNFTFNPNQNTLNCSQGIRDTSKNSFANLPIRENLRKSDTKTKCTCGRKIANKKSLETQTSRQNVNFVLEENPCKGTCNTFNNVEHFPKEETPGKSFIFKEVQCSSDLSKGTSTTFDNSKRFPREEIRENSNCERDKNVFPKNSKLKVYVHKGTSTSCSKVVNPPKVSNLSLPCKSSHLIVQLFEADPSLSDSCLILMKKKFEKDMHNACSCLNDILKKLDTSAIRKLRLNCEIRSGRVDLSLKRKEEGTSNARWFLARVPTCSNIHKRVYCDGNVESWGNSKDLPVDPRCCMDVTKREEEFEEGCVAFYSICSNQSLTEGKRISVTGNEMEKGEEVNFVWKRKKEKQMEFVLSSGLTKSRENGDSEASFEEDSDKTCGKMADEICERRESVFLAEKKEEEEGECIGNEEIGDFDGRNEICENLESERMELKETDCSCDNKEENLMCGDCNPGRCFCHVFCANSRLNEKTDDFGKETFKVQECPKIEENTLDTEMQKEDIFESKNILPVENTWKSERRISYHEEKKESTVEVKEIYSVDSTRTSNFNSTEISRDTRCSCCGDDLSNSLTNKEADRKATRSTKYIKSKGTISILKTDRTSNLTVPENAENIISEDTKNSSTFRSSKFEIISSENRGENYDQENVLINKTPGSSKVSCEKNPSIPESLFVFCRTNSNRSSSSSNSFADEETPSNVIPQENTECECLRRKPILRSFCQRSFSNSCSKWNFARCKLKGKIKEGDVPMVPRYKNRSWRGLTVPNSLCSSFPVVDRIKYLIRKKLRKLLLEERDKGTSTSKTFLGNDRYLVSISSGKLTDNRIIRDSCSAGSSIRCPFTTRNRYEARGAPEKTFTEGGALRRKKEIFGSNVKDERCEKVCPEETFTEGSFLRKKRDLPKNNVNKGRCERVCRDYEAFIPKEIFTEESFLRKKKDISEDNVNKGRCERACRDYDAFIPEETFTGGSFSRKRKDRSKCRGIIQGNNLFRKIGIGQRSGSKSTDTQDLIKEKKETFLRSKLKNKNKRSDNYCFTDGGNKTRSSIVSSNTTKIVLFEDDDYYFLTKKVFQEKNQNFKESTVTKNFYSNFNGTKNRSTRNQCVPGFSGSTSEEKRNGGGEDTVGRIYRDRLISLEKRLLEEDNNFSTFLGDYEKRINDLDTDFRLKLLQYVALCRSVKNSLMKSLQPDDVYEISSSSV